MLRLRALATFAVIGGAMFFGTGAQAQVIDPQIFVQQSGQAPAGGDPNIITNTDAFVIGVAGNFVLQDPLLVAVADYNGLGLPSISYSGCANPSACSAALVGTYGITTNSINFTSGDLYNQLGFTQAGGSISFTNLSDADVANGFAAPSSFLVDVFALPVNLTSGSAITIDTTAPGGSFILGFGCEDGTGSGSGCTTNGNVGQTVMTNAGLVGSSSTPVPEPSSLVLAATGLFGLWGIMSRRRIGLFFGNGGPPSAAA